MTQKPFYDKLDYSEAFLARRAIRFSSLLVEQGKLLYSEFSVMCPVEASSTILFLKNNQPASLADMARALGQSHQLVAQRITGLMKLSLIRRKIDKNDQRRKLYTLTPKGLIDAAKVEEICQGAANVFLELIKEIEIDIFAAFDRAEKVLVKENLSDRYKRLILSKDQEAA